MNINQCKRKIKKCKFDKNGRVFFFFTESSSLFRIMSPTWKLVPTSIIKLMLFVMLYSTVEIKDFLNDTEMCSNSGSTIF